MGGFPPLFPLSRDEMKIELLLSISHPIPGGLAPPCPPLTKAIEGSGIEAKGNMFGNEKTHTAPGRSHRRAEGNMFIVIFKVNTKPRLWKEGRGSSVIPQPGSQQPAPQPTNHTSLFSPPAFSLHH